MMTKSSSQIRTPEAEQLAHWKAMSDAAQAHKFFSENPKIIDKLASSIQGAYALTEDERNERDNAVKAAADAKTEVKKAQMDKAQAVADAEKAKKDADDYAKKVRIDADNYKKSAMTEVAKAQQKVIDDKEEVAQQQNTLAGELKQLGIDQKKVSDGLQKIEDWKSEKEAWEQDYTERSTKLDAKLRKAVKG